MFGLHARLFEYIYSLKKHLICIIPIFFNDKNVCLLDFNELGQTNKKDTELTCVRDRSKRERYIDRHKSER